MSQKVEDIKAAIHELFGDDTVPAEVTRAELEEIRDEIEELLEQLRADKD